MFYIYHSNDLDVQQGILLELMAQGNVDPFQSETILVQSPGMAKWLQLQIAETKGIAANLNFPMPASFIWQQYADNLPNVEQQSQFKKDAMAWRLMQIIPNANIPQLDHYLHSSTQSEQQKRYQLALKVADLFDQYLVYRPDWIDAWEKGNDNDIVNQIEQQVHSEKLREQIRQSVQWQGKLWRRLIADIQQQNGGVPVQHRAHLHREYLTLQANQRPRNLPSRLFVFGISALPKSYLITLESIAQHCDVHLFFNNPSKEYWADIVDSTFLQRLRLKKRENYLQQHSTDFKAKEISAHSTALFSDEQLNHLDNQQIERTQDDEMLQVGNPLLSVWGKLGRDFFHLLTQTDAQEIQAFTELTGDSLLRQVQRNILNLAPNQTQLLNYDEQEQSLSFHACHSPMREVEALHDHLLRLFQQDPDLTPKDIVVMVANVDAYQPYIQAVFGQYQRRDDSALDARYIPFSISDNKLSANDVLIATFLSLLNLQESPFSAEAVLALLDVPAVRDRFGITLNDLETLRHWVADSGIRFGLDKQTENAQNANAWQAGLQRMLLGFAMREEDGVWQNEVAFDNTYGLKGVLVGALAAFVERLQQWQQDLMQSHSMEQWLQILTALVDDFFEPNNENADTLLYVKDCVQQLAELLQQLKFEQPIASEVIADVLTEKLDEQHHSLKFLVGKVNFCTLLPMRAIPFKVVCLLGMNDADYPRQQTPNSFDLMQYHRQKGDRSRRDDDRYLFLEALLAAQQSLYISYVGRSVVDNQALEPSVLVKQLLDYVNENLKQDEKSQKNEKIEIKAQAHPMRIFSPENFKETHRTFAKEWLPLVNTNNAELGDFAAQPLNAAIDPIERLDIAQLTQFVRNPVQYFFEKQLGVYFRDNEQLIDDSENFTLNSLEHYQIKDSLLSHNENELDEFFMKLRLKGVAPRAEFAQIYEEKVRSEIQPFYSAIEDYLAQTPQTENLELTLDLGDRKIQLYGQLNSLFGDEKQRVTWRVSSMKDGFKIENWLAYLWQVATTARQIAPLFYCKKDSNVECHSFEMVEKSSALALLTCYVQAYLNGMKQIQLVPTALLDNVLKMDPKNETQNIAILQDLAQGDDYRQGDEYWQRVLMQTQHWDWETLINQTKDWFAEMQAHSKKC